MKYWYIIHGQLTEEEGRQLWDKLSVYRASLTILFDKTYVYGEDDDQYAASQVAKVLANLGYEIERG